MATNTMMAFAFGLIMSPVVAQPVADKQSSALRGLNLEGSEWTPAASAEGQQIVDPEIDQEFVLRVQSALGTHFLDDNKDRIADITKSLRPTFASVSKNEYGKLEHAAVRYILHRLFVARHGWRMKGLDPAGQEFDSASPVRVLEGKTSMEVQGLFDERLAAQGFGLRELAVFASVLESLISEEVSEKLQKLRRKMQLASDHLLTGERAMDVIELYMVEYIIGDTIPRVLSIRDLHRLRPKMARIYNFWPETQKLLRETAAEVLGASQNNSFTDVGRVLTLVGERFGKFQNIECELLKKRLIDLESDEKGCVSLSKFYEGKLHSQVGEGSTEGQDWQFGEHIDYLKVNGMIDEYDPDDMKVMIANYVNGPANCIATSHYYSICCIDECEALMGNIESRVSGPIAAPDEIAVLVAALPSSTVPANRTLPPSQMHRLQKIAEKHDGYVPLHGRLFMQWMHMVYPRECAYPHMSGTTRPLTSAEWTDSMDRSSTATNEEMAHFVDAPVRNTSSRSGQGQCGRWIDEEELYIGGQTTQRRNLHELETDYETWLAASSVALLCVLAATTLAVIQAAKSLKKKLCPSMSWMQERPLMYV